MPLAETLVAFSLLGSVAVRGSAAMFQEAAAKHLKSYCQVGGGSGPDTKDIKFHGVGSALNANHIITARHVWTTIKDHYEFPVVFTKTEMIRCGVAFESAEYDILILRRVDVLIKLPVDSEEQYVALSAMPLELGASVGFISDLKLPQPLRDCPIHAHFSSATVSMIFPPTKLSEGLLFALSGTVIQPGFSGSAVFRPDGSIVGVLVKTLSFRADFENLRAPIYVLPVVSPIWPLNKQINAVVSPA
jgi:hypothetical protein